MKRNSLHNVSDSDEETPPPPNKISQHDFSKPPCKYWDKCYRKNLQHLRDFSHPLKLNATDSDKNETNANNISSTQQSVSPKCPSPSCNLTEFGMFLTKVSPIKNIYFPEISLPTILSPEMGDLVSSVQFSYMFDVPWLLSQYPAGFRNKPLLLVHGKQGKEKQEFDEEISKFDNVSACQAPLEIAYGTHHSKMMLLFYSDGMRIVIHTANMYADDWLLRTQGLWMSEKLPRCVDVSKPAPDSATCFRSELASYLRAYGRPRLTALIEKLFYHDFSSIKVCLVASVPGRHVGSAFSSFGINKLGNLLGQHVVLENIAPSSPKCIVAQFSSIGSLGSHSEAWLTTEFLAQFSKHSLDKTTNLSPSNKLKLIYPCVEDVRQSLEGYPAGGSLPYQYATAVRQPWLKQFMHCWRASRSGRTHASPHIKSFACINQSDSSTSASAQIYWFLLTSANLSKAAWGVLEKQKSQLMIRSYELGVIFLPKFFECKQFCVCSHRQQPVGDLLPTSSSSSSSSPSEHQVKCFPIPWDFPLTAYATNDEPWIVNISHAEKPDRHGNVWVPN